MIHSPERKMFFGSKPVTFIRARNLRENMTNAELILWNKIRNNQLLGFRFKAQHPVAGFIADFYCHKAKLVIEADGLIHQTQKEYDLDRDRVFNDLGLTVIRFSNEEIDNSPDSVIQIITNFLSGFNTKKGSERTD